MPPWLGLSNYKSTMALYTDGYKYQAVFDKSQPQQSARPFVIRRILSSASRPILGNSSPRSSSNSSNYPKCFSASPNIYKMAASYKPWKANLKSSFSAPRMAMAEPHFYYFFKQLLPKKRKSKDRPSFVPNTDFAYDTFIKRDIAQRDDFEPETVLYEIPLNRMLERPFKQIPINQRRLHSFKFKHQKITSEIEQPQKKLSSVFLRKTVEKKHPLSPLSGLLRTSNYPGYKSRFQPLHALNSFDLKVSQVLLTVNLTPLWLPKLSSRKLESAYTGNPPAFESLLSENKKLLDFAPSQLSKTLPLSILIAIKRAEKVLTMDRTKPERKEKAWLFSEKGKRPKLLTPALFQHSLKTKFETPKSIFSAAYEKLTLTSPRTIAYPLEASLKPLPDYFETSSQLQNEKFIPPPQASFCRHKFQKDTLSSIDSPAKKISKAAKHTFNPGIHLESADKVFKQKHLIKFRRFYKRLENKPAKLTFISDLSEELKGTTLKNIKCGKPFTKASYNSATATQPYFMNPPAFILEEDHIASAALNSLQFNLFSKKPFKKFKPGIISVEDSLKDFAPFSQVPIEMQRTTHYFLPISDFQDFHPIPITFATLQKTMKPERIKKPFSASLLALADFLAPNFTDRPIEPDIKEDLYRDSIYCKHLKPKNIKALKQDSPSIKKTPLPRSFLYRMTSLEEAEITFKLPEHVISKWIIKFKVSPEAAVHNEMLKADILPLPTWQKKLHSFHATPPKSLRAFDFPRFALPKLEDFSIVTKKHVIKPKSLLAQKLPFNLEFFQKREKIYRKPLNLKEPRQFLFTRKVAFFQEAYSSELAEPLSPLSALPPPPSFLPEATFYPNNMKNCEIFEKFRLAKGKTPKFACKLKIFRPPYSFSQNILPDKIHFFENLFSAIFIKFNPVSLPAKISLNKLPVLKEPLFKSFSPSLNKHHFKIKDITVDSFGIMPVLYIKHLFPPKDIKRIAAWSYKFRVKSLFAAYKPDYASMLMLTRIPYSAVKPAKKRKKIEPPSYISHQLDGSFKEENFTALFEEKYRLEEIHSQDPVNPKLTFSDKSFSALTSTCMETRSDFEKPQTSIESPSSGFFTLPILDHKTAQETHNHFLIGDAKTFTPFSFKNPFLSNQEISSHYLAKTSVQTPSNLIPLSDVFWLIKSEFENPDLNFNDFELQSLS